ncbi:MAG: type II toxin-antitoxin system HipA family toxin [Nitrospirae bacterium]|nr:type II toxin-antitoxin system HipA family toxin [Nitrospirota bacterium]
MPDYFIGIEIEGKTIPVGTLAVFENRGKDFTRFQYDNAWIEHPLGFEIDPMLPLVKGFSFRDSRLPGAFQDISPDRWGRLLQERAKSGYISDIGPMIGVSDSMRLGAIRISLASDPENYLSPHANIPKFVMISELMEAIRRVEEDAETSEDLRMLLDPGASLGGARPKAIVQDGGAMWIAKFPSQGDSRRMALWEAMMLKMAGTVGIKTPEFKVIIISERSPVLLVRRFDRTEGGDRIHFMSAMTMLGRDEQSANLGSYIGIVDAMTVKSANPGEDAKQLWKRMVFNVLTGNTDDHLRNHGFLRTTKGWVLSPAYDLNPTRLEKRAHALSFDGKTNVPDLELCLALAPYFRYGRDSEAKNDLERIRESVSGWKQMAKEIGLEAREITRMEKAFEISDLPLKMKGSRVK